MIADSVGKVDSSGPTAKQKELYKEYSPINHMKAGMKYPPVYMVYTTDHGIHTSLWGKKIKDKAEKIGAEAYLQLKDHTFDANGVHAYKDEMDFALDKFGLNELRAEYLS